LCLFLKLNDDDDDDDDDDDFTGGQEVQNLASFSTSLNFEPPAFENVARYPNPETNFLCRPDLPMFLPSLVKWVYAPLRTVGQKCPTR